MKGRQPGRPTKFVTAAVLESIPLGKPGIKIEVWEKWKRNRKKLGTLKVTVGGLRWRPINGKKTSLMNWNELAEWFESA